jgi:phenylalanine-4-hydroxylase
LQVGDSSPFVPEKTDCSEDEVPQLQDISEVLHLLPLSDLLMQVLIALIFPCREDEVPQLQDISEVLQQSSGWQVRPVAGLMHPRDFLNGLAFK